MGFLSAFEGFRKIMVDEGRGYWVELLDYVSQGAKEDAERTLSKVVMVGATAQPSPDVARYRQLMVLASIRGWNLDDDAGRVWPLDLKHVQMLPGHIFDDLWKEVDGSNKERTPEEERQFPAEDVFGDSDGLGGSTELFELPSEA